MIIDYEILWSSEETMLKIDIRRAIESGWQPHGSLVIQSMPGSEKPMFYKEMVKHEGPKAEAVVDEVLGQAGNSLSSRDSRPLTKVRY